MQVTCFANEAFYKLIDELIDRIKEKEKIQDKWISTEEAMNKLRIKSKTTFLCRSRVFIKSLVCGSMRPCVCFCINMF